MDKFLFLASLALAFWALLSAWGRSEKNDKPADLSLDWAEALWVSLVALAIYTGWVGVILASCRHFSLSHLTIGVGLFTAALIGKFGITLRPKFRPITLWEMALGGLLVFCAVIYLRPHEFLLGGTDAGTYVNMGAVIAGQGALAPLSDWYKFLDAHGLTTMRSLPGPQPVSSQIQFVGWMIDPDGRGQLIPQFLPFHPVWLAIAFSLFGLYGALALTPLWALLGLGAVYFFGRKLVHPFWGLIGAALLAITPVLVYFSRYPTTEPLTLLLIFTGLLAFLRLQDSQDTPIGWGIVGGAAFGAALLTRIDLPLLAVLVLGGLALQKYRRAWSPGWTAFSLVLFIFLGHLVVQVLLFSQGYFWVSYSLGLQAFLGPWKRYLVYGLPGLAILLFLSVYCWKKKGPALRQVDYGKWFRRLLVIAAAGLSLYAYFLRPLVEPVTFGTSWPSGDRFPVLNGQNWVRLGWYLTPLGLILATAGFMGIALRESPLARWGLFLTLGLLTTIQYVYNIMIPPYHIYAMRRYVPIVLPTLILFSAYGLYYGIFRRHKSWMRATGIGLLCLLAGGMLYQSRKVLRHRDFPGVVEQMNALHRSLPPGAMVLISEAPEAIFADRIGPPLQHIYGHQVATVYNQTPGPEAFLKALLEKSRQEKKPLYLLAGHPVLPAVRRALTLVPEGISTLSLTSLQNTYDRYPTAVERALVPVERYRVAGLSSLSVKPAGPLQIDIGGYDALFLIQGFYQKDFIPRFPSFRWTGGRASLEFPAEEKGRLDLVLRAARFLPPGLPQKPVSLSLDGRPLGSFVPSDQWQTFQLSGTALPQNGFSLLELSTPTYNPAKQQVSPDSRDLGLALDWIRVNPVRDDD